jgi:hypothetical protein
MPINILLKIKLIKLWAKWMLFKFRFTCWIKRKHEWYHYYEIDETGEPETYIRECLRCGLEEKFDIFENRLTLDKL